MSKTYRRSKSFYDYESGVCDRCQQFLTDCVCNDIAALNKGGFNLEESGICEECFQSLDNCLCNLYTDTEVDHNYTYPVHYEKLQGKSFEFEKYDDIIYKYGVISNPFEYDSFEDLKKKITSNHYTIEHVYTGSHISVIAPHGGCIEEGTTELAKMIAETEYNFYSFVGIGREETDLHITSHKFNEPTCIKLVEQSHTVISIHGCPGMDEKIYVGGRDAKLKKKVSKKLSLKGFKVYTEGHIYPGTHPENVCNLGLRKKGLQLEFTQGIRKNQEHLRTISKVVHQVLGSSIRTRA